MTHVAFSNVRGEATRPLVKMDASRRRLSTIVARHAPNDRPFVVSLHRHEPGTEAEVRPTDESVRLRSQWAQTLVGSDTVVLITTLPLGGGSSAAGGSASTGKSVGMALAAVALAIAAPGIGTAAAGVLGIGTIGGQLIAAGLVVGDTGYFNRKEDESKCLH
jgi:hypothetical protein